MKPILITETALYLSIFRINGKEKFPSAIKQLILEKGKQTIQWSLPGQIYWGFRPVMPNQGREKWFYGYGHNNAPCHHGDLTHFGAGGSTVHPFASLSLELSKEQAGGNSI